MESGDGELEGSDSSLTNERESFRFFEEDVLTVSCTGSSEAKAGDGRRGGRDVRVSVGAGNAMMAPHASGGSRRRLAGFVATRRRVPGDGSMK